MHNDSQKIPNCLCLVCFCKGSPELATKETNLHTQKYKLIRAMITKTDLLFEKVGAEGSLVSQHYEGWSNEAELICRSGGICVLSRPDCLVSYKMLRASRISEKAIKRCEQKTRD